MDQQSVDSTAAHRRPVVLCVDDETRILGALSRLLWQEPINVMLTQDPQEALELIGRGHIRVVIADQRMPGMSGTMLLRTVQETSPQTARVMLTAHPDSALVTERTRGTIQCLITKPWSDQILRQTIRQFIAGSGSYEQ
ncbi:MAG: response regulator [Planctomycetes bacterium]|nr:response regulator [Planctomycetota bacterium]